MIISALASYYEQLLRGQPGAVARPGWEVCKVDYLLVLSERGNLVKVVPAGGEKGVATVVPARVKRSSGVRANFLCDTPAYLLGVDSKGNLERAKSCFVASAARHLELLDGVKSPMARAILTYFDNGVPDACTQEESGGGSYRDACAGGNITFALLTKDGCLLNGVEDEAVARAWDREGASSEDEAELMVCLATGSKLKPARLHPAIKGVAGAQSSGASLVSFNALSFESYGHDGEQGRNAPVGEDVAQAYGAGLNYLLSNREHRLRMSGDTTVVFWSERADYENTNLFSLLLGGTPSGVERDKSAADGDLFAALSALSSGKQPDLGGVDFSSPFHVLGLAPNNARLVVRFYLADSFGKMLENVEKHYRRIRVVHAPFEREVLTPYWLLSAVENEMASSPIVSSELSASLLRAILNGERYPESLYSNCLLRIKASRDVSYAQAAIIRGYLIRNQNRSEEEVTAELNEDRCDVAYNLGRAFSYLGQIQEAANGNDTLTGRYLDSACSRPAVAFPSLLRLSSDHLRKLSREKPGLAVNLERGLMDALAEDRVSCFPKHLSLSEQGDFMLGYYHQKAKRYQKKTDESAKEVNNDDKEA